MRLVHRWAPALCGRSPVSGWNRVRYRAAPIAGRSSAPDRRDIGAESVISGHFACVCHLRAEHRPARADHQGARIAVAGADNAVAPPVGKRTREPPRFVVSGASLPRIGSRCARLVTTPRRSDREHRATLEPAPLSSCNRLQVWPARGRRTVPRDGGPWIHLRQPDDARPDDSRQRSRAARPARRHRSRATRSSRPTLCHRARVRGFAMPAAGAFGHPKAFVLSRHTL